MIIKIFRFHLRSVFATVRTHHMKQLSSPPCNCYLYKHFCTFVTHINRQDDYTLDSMTKESHRLQYLSYPHNIIRGFRTIQKLIHWKQKSMHKLNKNQRDAVFATLIAQCISLNEYDAAWNLFEESKQCESMSIFIYTTMFQLIYKQYVSSKPTQYDHKAVRLTRKLHSEMKSMHGFEPSATCYGVILKTYVTLNEYELAEQVWNEYLSNVNQMKGELDSYTQTTDMTSKPSDKARIEYVHFSKKLEDSIIWNYVLSLYRRQNKMDKVFEIYNTILMCKVIKLHNATFIQVLVAIAQIIQTQKDKSHDIPKHNEICHQYVIYAETLLIDAHHMCEDVRDPRYSKYSYLYSGLLQCYSNSGAFHIKCRNFWKFWYHKDIKYLFEAFDDSNHSQMDQAFINEMQYSADIDDFCICQVFACIQNCCQLNAKYDKVGDHDIYPVVDDILHVLHHSDEPTLRKEFGRIFFDWLQICSLILENVGHFDPNKCFLYMFKFYDCYAVFGNKPSRSELSTFTRTAALFFKYHKYFASSDPGDLAIIHQCVNKSKFDAYLNSQCRKYNVDPNTLLYKPKLGHKRHCG
eukprot:85007_1